MNAPLTLFENMRIIFTLSLLVVFAYLTERILNSNTDLLQLRR